MRPIVKMRCVWGIGLLMMFLFLSGCGKGGLGAVRGLESAGVNTVLAAVPVGFTPSSRVSAIDDNTYLIGVEAVLPPGFSKWNLPFQLPPGRTITSVQGTISHRAACFSQALGVVAVDGTRYADHREARREWWRIHRLRELHHPGELYQRRSGDPAGSRSSLQLHWNDHLGVSGNDPSGVIA